VTLKLVVSRSRPSVPYGAHLFYTVFCYGCMLAFVVLDLVFQYQSKILAGKNNSEMTYFVSGGT